MFDSTRVQQDLSLLSSCNTDQGGGDIGLLFALVSKVSFLIRWLTLGNFYKNFDCLVY